MKNWYIVQTFSGFEHKVADTLKETIKAKELSEKIGMIFLGQGLALRKEDGGLDSV